MKPFNNSFLHIVHFLWKFIYLTRFHSLSIFNRFIPLVSVMILHDFFNLHMWLILIHFLVSTLLGRDLWMLHWLMFLVLQAFLTKDNFMSSMFDVWPSGHYPRMFCIRQYVVCIRLVRNGKLMPPFIPTS